MSISTILIAAIFFAIVMVLAKLFLSIVKPSEPVPAIVWAVSTIICLLILLGLLRGDGGLNVHW